MLAELLERLQEKVYAGGKRAGVLVLLAGLAVIGLGVWVIEYTPAAICGVMVLPVGLVIIYVGLVATAF